MSSHEDFFYNVYHEIVEMGIKDDFYKQLDKMKFQDHHKYKTVKETWDYAHKKLVLQKRNDLKSKNVI